MRFGKEETGSEEKRLREQRGLVPPSPVLTRLRRPYLFSRKRKDREEKSAWTRLVLPASDFRQAPMVQASFHMIVTLRVFYYAPPDTWVSNLELVSLETVAVNRRCGGEPDGSYLLAGQIVRTKRKSNAKRCRPTNLACIFYLPQIFKRNCHQIMFQRIRRRVLGHT